MKKTLMLCCILAIPAMIYAQYPPFLNTDGWCVNFTAPEFDVELNLNYHLTTDEIIDGLHYTKVEYDDGEPNFLREDTAAKKVWMHSPYYDHEILLYDFTLEAGDSIGLELFDFDTVKYYVSYTDSILTFAGKRRSIFLLSSMSGIEDVIWVEGLGSLNGPFYIYDYNCSIAGSQRTGCMLCAYSGDAQIFEGSCTETCSERCGYFLSDKIEDIPAEDITISSSGNMLLIRSPQYTILDVSIYSSDGKLLDRISDVRQNTFSIKGPDTGTGLKLISVRTEKGVQNQLVFL